MQCAFNMAKKQQHDQCVAAGHQSWANFSKDKSQEEIFEHFSAMGKIGGKIEGAQSWANFSENKSKEEISEYFSAMGKQSYAKFSCDKTQEEISAHYSAMEKKGGKQSCATFREHETQKVKFAAT